MGLRSIRIIVDGATGRLARTQHLERALLAIRAEGGLQLANGDRLIPEPILLGRNPQKLEALAAGYGGLEWSIDAAACLRDPTVALYFDASATAGRSERASRAIDAGKHIYLEKPIAGSLDEAIGLARSSAAAGLKNGTVQDKLSLPGLRKLIRLREAGFFGRILSVRLDFGWWIFDGDLATAQRPSWNYKKREGGGLILDMFPHWRYIIEHVAGDIRSVCCRARTSIPRRWDEDGAAYEVDVEDDVRAILELEDGAMAQISSSWASRVKRDDLFQIQIDGSNGSAVAGLHRCVAQSLAATPKPVWSVDAAIENDLDAYWQEIPETEPYRNGYRHGWESFLRHVVEDAPFSACLIEGAKGVQLAEACHRSDAERRWIDLPRLSA